MPLVSINGPWTNRPVGTSLSSETFQKRPLAKYFMFPSEEEIDAPSIGTRSVDDKSLVHTTLGCLRPKCKGLPQGTLVGPWGVVPRRFNNELILIRVRRPSTNFHQFLTPKT